MRSTRPVYFALLVFFLVLSTTSIISRAADDEPEDAEEYDVKARVVRISLMGGEVRLKRKDNTEWEKAQLNHPLVEGDTISTAADSRVELQLDARNFVRLGANSILRIVTLRDEGVALSVIEGSASIRLAKFAGDKEYFEVDAPKTTLAVEKSGVYRIDVGKDGRVRLTARDGGRARIYSETSGFALRDGRSADLIIDGPDAGEWEMLAAARDSWDDWFDERERYLAQRLRYDTQYYDNDVWGAEDLDAYGAWTYTNDYGWIWRPHATVITSYSNWAPYRYGQWTWVDPYGWTWIGNEPWGWAPYHYGRWVHYNNYWAWSPRSQYYRKRSWWRPALVAFVSLNLSFGNEICWYPLSYHHRDPRSRNYHRGSGDDRRDGRDRRDHDGRDDRRRYPGHWGGVTAIPARDFGSRNPRPHPANEREARRVVSTEPLPNVPIRPARETNRPATAANGANGANRDRPERRMWDRRDGSGAGPNLPQRRTGAAERNPGVPLDTELRQSRIWNGREARRQEFPVPTGGAGTVEARPTGVVERPTRANREVERDGNRRSQENRGAREDRNVDRLPDRDERSERPSRAIRQPDVPRSSESNDRRVTPSEVPVNTPANEERAPTDRPARSEPYYRPSPVDRGERPERPERRERNESPRHAPPERRSEPTPAVEQPSRQEQPRHSEPAPRNDPTPRYEPPQRSEPPSRHSGPERSESQPRYDPPSQRSGPERSESQPRYEPPPRSEPPQRNDPPPRSEPVPQRSEPERSEPPPRNEPPAPAEPARSEPPRSEPSREENVRPQDPG